jgi:hypothetical protein
MNTEWIDSIQVVHLSALRTGDRFHHGVTYTFTLILTARKGCAEKVKKKGTSGFILVFGEEQEDRCAENLEIFQLLITLRFGQGCGPPTLSAFYRYVIYFFGRILP